MEQVDTLFINAHILTMDPDYHQYFKGAVAIQNNCITAVGEQKELQEKYQAAQVIDCQGRVLLPGLVNAHTHAPMTLLRGLADDLRLDVWLMGYMMPVEREFVSHDFVHLGTSLACAEMIRSGVTSFADMYYFEEDVAKAATTAGMRAVCGQTVMKYPAPDAQAFEESLALAREFIINWKDHPLIVPAVSPHAPYTCTAEILRSCAELAAEFDVPLHTHISETLLEVENMRNEQGMPVVPYVKKQGLFEAKVLAAHCVHIDEGEMRTLLHYNAGVAHNPSSNLKLASGAAPIKKMLETGLNVGIGTDGPASNNDLDMFEEIRLAAFLAKGFSGDPTALPARTVLTMATRMGAEAMHIGHLTGSLEVGKRADLIVVDLDTLHNSPRFERDPNGVYAQIIYATKSTDVVDVMIDGKMVMRNRQVLTLDEKNLLEGAAEYAKKIDRFLFLREKSVLSKLIAIGGASEVESFEVQMKAQISSTDDIVASLDNTDIEILRKRHYHEYDTYFGFDAPELDRLRYREDDFISESGQVENTRFRLTLIGPNREQKLAENINLSRSKFIAPASQSLRFYREYFKPSHITEVEKDRLRYRILYQGIEFYVNIDQLIKPIEGRFIEIKSRTWSLQDAENKSRKVNELLQVLMKCCVEPVTKDYIEMLD
jgi:5-methylthioadenosine/S-adenosylhomocysteine deaminase